MPTALIVEDEPDANELLCLLVRSRGYRTESVFRGRDAPGAVARARPEVVFLDLMLPDLDGFQICRGIKAEAETALIPVVIVTARLTRDCEAEAYEAGANGFVRKPYLAPTIFEALAAARAWREEVLGDSSGGAFSIEPGDPLGSLREIAGLSSRLVARTRLPPLEVAAVVEGLRLVRESVLGWAARNRSTGGATVRFETEHDGVTIRVEDQAGWLDEFAREEGYETLAARGGFDEVSLRPAEGVLTLIRREG